MHERLRHQQRRLDEPSRNALKRLELARELDPTKPEPKKKGSSGSSGKCSGEKRASQGNDFVASPKEEAARAS